MKQPFKNCKIVCGDEPCHSKGMCYATMYMNEKVEEELKNKNVENDTI